MPASLLQILAVAGVSTLALAAVAAATVKVELAVRRIRMANGSRTPDHAKMIDPSGDRQADNRWLSSIVRSFDD